jgi:hypothetical protein
MSFTEPTNHPNARASSWFGVAIFVLFIAAQAACYFVHPELKLFESESFLTWDALALALCIVFGVINIQNKFETNENWKTYGGVVAIVYLFFLVGIFVSKGA